MLSIQTPWGHVDHVKDISGDLQLIRADAASHGGFGVSLNAKMPKHLQSPGIRSGEYLWFEEDQDWALVAVAFPQHFHTEARPVARQILLDLYPEIFTVHFGRETGVHESRNLPEMVPTPATMYKSQAYSAC